MKVKLLDGAVLPTRSHDTDAGLDLYSRNDYMLFPGEGVAIDTGVCIELPHGTFGMVANRSGLNIKHGIVCGGVGIVDESYRGSIVVKLYNMSLKSYHIKAGDRIAQLLVIPCLFPTLEVTDTLDDTERGNQGIGSSGR